MKIIQTKKSSSRFEIIACNSAENLLQKDSTSLPFLHLESFGVTCFSQFELIFELYAEHISFFNEQNIKRNCHIIFLKGFRIIYFLWIIYFILLYFFKNRVIF